MHVIEQSIVKKLAPNDMVCLGCAAVNHNDQLVQWCRYVMKIKGAQLGGQHVSMTYDFESKRLMGYMSMRSEFAVPCVTIQEETARRIAFEFLANYARELVDSVEVRWIKPQRQEPQDPPHDLGFALDGELDVIGMRVKLWMPEEKAYAWVIVSNEEQVISFERNVLWDSERHCRGTQQWLHDMWLQQTGKSLTLLSTEQ